MKKQRAYWNECCWDSWLDIGWYWVQDYRKLLLWVPRKYRKDLHYSSVYVFGGDTTSGGIMRPQVDVGRLFEFSGTNWTKIYEPHE